MREPVWKRARAGLTIDSNRQHSSSSSPSSFSPPPSPRVLVLHLHRYLVRLQQDAEPAIRTNCCICLGRLAVHFNEASIKRYLLPGFVRALQVRQL